MKNKTATAKTASGAETEMLTAEEVSLRLRLPLSTVYYLAKTGALPGFQLGRSWRFSSSDLDRLAQPKSARPHILEPDKREKIAAPRKKCPLNKGDNGNNCRLETIASAI